MMGTSTLGRCTIWQWWWKHQCWTDVPSSGDVVFLIIAISTTGSYDDSVVLARFTARSNSGASFHLETGGESSYLRWFLCASHSGQIAGGAKMLYRLYNVRCWDKTDTVFTAGSYVDPAAKTFFTIGGSPIRGPSSHEAAVIPITAGCLITIGENNDGDCIFYSSDIACILRSYKILQLWPTISLSLFPFKLWFDYFH